MWEYSRNCMNQVIWKKTTVTSIQYNPDVASSVTVVLLVVIVNCESECKLLYNYQSFYEPVFFQPEICVIRKVHSCQLFPHWILIYIYSQVLSK